MWTEADLSRTVDQGRIEWRKHALARMMEREISRLEVLHALRSGRIIESYVDDTPFASALVHSDESPPLHVVAALDTETNTVFVITAYRPDEAHFEPDLKRRKAR